MKKQILASLVLCIVAFGSFATARAESTLNGTWSILTDAGRPRLEVRWVSPDGSSHDTSTHDVDVSALGIAAALASSGQHVRFTLHREAGDFAMEGWAGGGKGGGTYEFSPNAAFFDDLRKRGVYVDSAEEQMTAANLDITREFVDGVQQAAVKPDFLELVEFRALDVDGAFIRDMASVGFAHLEPHQLVEMRALHIDRNYVVGMRETGMTDLDAHTLIELKALHVDGAYVQELAAGGYAHLSARDYIQLKALHVDGEFIKRLAAHGFKNLTVEQLINYKALHIVE